MIPPLIANNTTTEFVSEQKTLLTMTMTISVFMETPKNVNFRNITFRFKKILLKVQTAMNNETIGQCLIFKKNFLGLRLR